MEIITGLIGIIALVLFIFLCNVLIRGDRDD